MILSKNNSITEKNKLKRNICKQQHDSINL
ncbi:hypothetical protein CLOHAE12215_02177 [Clostridium haemolyticum]|nr:hypothetical protein CLOHAE12215_02177 [Clostridium haemolyticum]